MKKSTAMISIIGLMVALGVVLGMPVFSFQLQIGGVVGKSFSFSSVPAMLTGLLFGPLAGAAAGALIDIIRALLFPFGAFNPLFTIPFALLGATPALICRLIMRGDAGPGKRPGYPLLLVSVLTSQLLWSCGLNTLLISLLYGKGFLVLLPARLLGLLLGPVYALVLQMLIRVYDRIRR